MSLARRVLWVGGTRLLFVVAAWWAGWTWLAWLLVGMFAGDVAVLMERRQAERLRAALAERDKALRQQEATMRLTGGAMGRRVMLLVCALGLAGSTLAGAQPAEDLVDPSTRYQPMLVTDCDPYAQNCPPGWWTTPAAFVYGASYRNPYGWEILIIASYGEWRRDHVFYGWPVYVGWVRRSPGWPPVGAYLDLPSWLGQGMWVRVD